MLPALFKLFSTVFFTFLSHPVANKTYRTSVKSSSHPDKGKNKGKYLRIAGTWIRGKYGELFGIADSMDIFLLSLSSVIICNNYPVSEKNLTKKQLVIPSFIFHINMLKYRKK